MLRSGPDYPNYPRQTGLVLRTESRVRSSRIIVPRCLFWVPGAAVDRLATVVSGLCDTWCQGSHVCTLQESELHYAGNCTSPTKCALLIVVRKA